MSTTGGQRLPKSVSLRHLRRSPLLITASGAPGAEGLKVDADIEHACLGRRHTLVLANSVETGPWHGRPSPYDQPGPSCIASGLLESGAAEAVEHLCRPAVAAFAAEAPSLLRALSEVTQAPADFDIEPVLALEALLSGRTALTQIDIRFSQMLTPNMRITHVGWVGFLDQEESALHWGRPSWEVPASWPGREDVARQAHERYLERSPELSTMAYDLLSGIANAITLSKTDWDVYCFVVDPEPGREPPPADGSDDPDDLADDACPLRYGWSEADGR